MPDHARTPAIRFAGFTGDWERRKLSEIMTEQLTNGIMNHSTLQDTMVKHINVINMYTPDRIHLDDLTFSEYGESAVKKCNVEVGDIFMTRSSIKPEGIAEANVLLDFGQFVFDDHLIRMKIDKMRHDPLFTKIALRNGYIKKQFIVKSKTTAFTTIGQDDIADCDGRFPTLEEQKQIASYFRNLDHLITLHQRKYDKLVCVKKSMLEKMFPRDGAVVPEIRFIGFSDAWEQRKVGELASDTYGGGTPSTSNEKFWAGVIPWIQSSDLTEHQVFGVSPKKHISKAAVASSATKVVPENSLAVITRVGVGKLAIMPFSYATSQDFLSLSKLKTDVTFTAYLLYKKLQCELNSVQGTSIKGITKEELLVKITAVPERREQEKIGAFFRNLDHLITLHQQELEKLKNIKKACLEKMFV